MERNEIRTKEDAVRYLDELKASYASEPPEGDIIARFERIEEDLREQTAGNTPAALFVDEADAPDPVVLQALVVFLTERGWRVAVDDVGEMWALPRDPLADPGDVQRNLN